MKPLYNFPSNVPETLIDAYIKVGRSCRKLEKELGIDHHYISLALKGIEPTDKTNKDRKIRVKLFFTAYRNPRRELLPGEKETKKKIALMAKATRQELGL